VTGRLFFWMLGLLASSYNIDSRDAHPFCNSRSASTSVSATKRQVVDHPVARSVSAVDRPSSITPLFVGDNRCQ
jgi:hypothetical protein